MINQSDSATDEPGIERTLNGTGYMISSLDEISEAFVDFASRQVLHPAIDIGAAFGVATHAALRTGVRMTANDIDPQHLEILNGRTPKTLQSQLSLVPGAFPDDLEFDANQFSAVLVSRVMHFFDGPQVERSIEAMYDWLMSGGKAFIVVEASIFLDHPVLRDHFEDSRAAGVRWPGFVDHVKSLLPRRAKFVPDQLHYLDPETLEDAFARGGFVVETSHHFKREVDPDDPSSGFRESVGLIARKP